MKKKGAAKVETPKAATTPQPAAEVPETVMLDVVGMVALVAAPIYGVLRYAGQPDMPHHKIRRQCIMDAMTLLGQVEAELPALEELRTHNATLKEIHETFDGPAPKKEKPYANRQEEPPGAGKPGEPEATDSPGPEGD